MNFTQKIYYNNKPLILTTNSKEYISLHHIAKGYLLLTGAMHRNYRLATEHMDKPGTLGVIIEDESGKALIKELENIYEPIDAGGGVVFNEDNDILMIFRRGKWDLPKGKRDDHEMIDACALREVSEETGLKKLVIDKKICNTYHIYAQNNKTLLKHTVWFKMLGTKSDMLNPQQEENILEARWVNEEKLPLIIFKSYDAIKEVLTNAGVKW